MQDTLKMNPIKRYVLAICVCERERESHLEEFSKRVDIISFLYARKQSPE